MPRHPLSVPVDGGSLVGWVEDPDGDLDGQAPLVLLLHGGPGLDHDYLEPLLPELRGPFALASYQQRGLGPSTTAGPFDVATHLADVLAVLDALGRERAVVVGHSWGGHLLLHLLAHVPDRVHAALVVDPLGAVGDGGLAEFSAALLDRIPSADAERWHEIEARWDAGERDESLVVEQLRLIWPAYHARTEHVPPFALTRIGLECSEQTWPSIVEGLPGLGPRLAGCSVPTAFVHGGASPMPVSASTESAAALGSAAQVEVLDDAGHFIWWERPGAVRAALDRLLRRASPL